MSGGTGQDIYYKKRNWRPGNYQHPRKPHEHLTCKRNTGECRFKDVYEVPPRFQKIYELEAQHHGYKTRDHHTKYWYESHGRQNYEDDRNYYRQPQRWEENHRIYNQKSSNKPKYPVRETHSHDSTAESNNERLVKNTGAPVKEPASPVTQQTSAEARAQHNTVNWPGPLDRDTAGLTASERPVKDPQCATAADENSVRTIDDCKCESSRQDLGNIATVAQSVDKRKDVHDSSSSHSAEGLPNSRNAKVATVYSEGKQVASQPEVQGKTTGHQEAKNTAMRPMAQGSIGPGAKTTANQSGTVSKSARQGVTKKTVQPRAQGHIGPGAKTTENLPMAHSRSGHPGVANSTMQPRAQGHIGPGAKTTENLPMAHSRSGHPGVANSTMQPRAQGHIGPGAKTREKQPMAHSRSGHPGATNSTMQPRAQGHIDPEAKTTESQPIAHSRSGHPGVANNASQQGTQGNRRGTETKGMTNRQGAHGSARVNNASSQPGTVSQGRGGRPETKGFAPHPGAQKSAASPNVINEAIRPWSQYTAACSTQNIWLDRKKLREELTPATEKEEEEQLRIALERSQLDTCIYDDIPGEMIDEIVPTKSVHNQAQKPVVAPSSRKNGNHNTPSTESDLVAECQASGVAKTSNGTHFPVEIEERLVQKTVGNVVDEISTLQENRAVVRSGIQAEDKAKIATGTTRSLPNQFVKIPSPPGAFKTGHRVPDVSCQPTLNEKATLGATNESIGGLPVKDTVASGDLVSASDERKTSYNLKSGQTIAPDIYSEVFGGARPKTKSQNTGIYKPKNKGHIPEDQSYGSLNMSGITPYSGVKFTGVNLADNKTDSKPKVQPHINHDHIHTGYPVPGKLASNETIPGYTLEDAAPRKYQLGENICVKATGNEHNPLRMSGQFIYDVSVISETKKDHQQPSMSEAVSSDTGVDSVNSATPSKQPVSHSDSGHCTDTKGGLRNDIVSSFPVPSGIPDNRSARDHCVETKDKLLDDIVRFDKRKLDNDFIDGEYNDTGEMESVAPVPFDINHNEPLTTKPKTKQVPIPKACWVAESSIICAPFQSTSHLVQKGWDSSEDGSEKDYKAYNAWKTTETGESDVQDNEQTDIQDDFIESASCVCPVNRNESATGYLQPQQGKTPYYQNMANFVKWASSIEATSQVESMIRPTTKSIVASQVGSVISPPEAFLDPPLVSEKNYPQISAGVSCNEGTDNHRSHLEEAKSVENGTNLLLNMQHNMNYENMARAAINDEPSDRIERIQQIEAEEHFEQNAGLRQAMSTSVSTPVAAHPIVGPIPAIPMPYPVPFHYKEYYPPYASGMMPSMMHPQGYPVAFNHAMPYMPMIPNVYANHFVQHQLMAAYARFHFAENRNSTEGSVSQERGDSSVSSVPLQ